MLFNARTLPLGWCENENIIYSVLKRISPWYGTPTPSCLLLSNYQFREGLKTQLQPQPEVPGGQPPVEFWSGSLPKTDQFVSYEHTTSSCQLNFLQVGLCSTPNQCQSAKLLNFIRRYCFARTQNDLFNCRNVSEFSTEIWRRILLIQAYHMLYLDLYRY